MANTATVASLDAARQRRHYIELAHATPAWLELAASWALEGIVMTDDDAERAGRMIAGHASYEQVVQEIRASHRQR
jgi:hypothetical protein